VRKHLRVKPGQDTDGQILVIVALGIIVFIAMVALVIDGGYAWGRQRATQNGADAAALAGVTVIAQNVAGTSPKNTDGDVGCAIAASATANELDAPVAVYTDVDGVPLTPAFQVGVCAPAGGVAVPAGAAGISVTGEQQFETLIAGAVGFSDFVARADATAITGALAGCPAGMTCPLAPVTVSITADLCDGSGKVSPGTSLWPVVSPDTANASNESIIALCKTGPGSFGGLDIGGPGCDSKDGFTVPCEASVPIPTWLQTSTGNIKNDIVGLNIYSGPQVGVADDGIILIPMHDNTCKSKPADTNPACPGGPWSGVGNNTYYHIPYFTGFMIDQAYRTKDDCNEGPGHPYPGGNGSTGCMKGWFVKMILQGPVSGAASGLPQDPAAIGIQLIN
jgi:Putative Flp pilus-assembly TadE/G-like